jgi:hypothetical protein
MTASHRERTISLRRNRVCMQEASSDNLTGAEWNPLLCRRARQEPRHRGSRPATSSIASAAASPIPTPIKPSCNPSRRIIHITSPLWAPSAMRMPAGMMARLRVTIVAARST